MVSKIQPSIIKLQESSHTNNNPKLHPTNPLSSDVAVLVGLGLSGRQARVYLTLLKIGQAINRQDIYRIIDELEQIGIVQRIISMPTTFSPTPLPETAKLLLSQKTAELINLHQKTKQLTKKFQTTNNSLTNQSNKKLQLGTIFEADRAKKYTRTIQSTYQSLDMVTSWKRFKQLTILLENQLQTALQKGVTIRIVTEKPSNLPLPK